MKYKLIIDKDAEESIVVTARRESELTSQIENLVLSYTGCDRISVYSDDELLELQFSEIECVTVIDRKVLVIDGRGRMYRTAQRLSTLEEMLPSSFIRINKSTLANERRILRFKTAINGAVDAVFKCGYKDYVSRRCFAEIKRRLDRK